MSVQVESSAREAAVQQLNEQLSALPQATEAPIRSALSKALLDYQSSNDGVALMRFADELIWTLRMHTRPEYHDAIEQANRSVESFDEADSVDVADYLKAAHERRLARRATT